MKMIRSSKILRTVVVLFMFILLISGQAFAQVTGRDVVNEALKYESRPVFTNSATFVQHVYGRVGIRLPNTLDELRRQTTLVRKGEQLQPGDIVFFGKSSTNLTAAGIFVGNGRFIVSYSPYGTIRVMSLSSTSTYLGAKRVINDIRERVIQEGLKYLGTPYQYNSDRSSTATFDCSDFVRRTYFDATGTWIPSNSRTQAAYVRENGKVTTNWRNLRRADLMFFADPSTGKINHVAIYMGDEQILHATSTKGVNVQKMNSYWNTRFTFGGNILD